MSRLRLHNDGQDFLCMDCGTTVPRSRDNPYPTHVCPSPKPQAEDQSPVVCCRNCGMDRAAHAEGAPFTCPSWNPRPSPARAPSRDIDDTQTDCNDGTCGLCRSCARAAAPGRETEGMWHCVKCAPGFRAPREKIASSQTPNATEREAPIEAAILDKIEAAINDQRHLPLERMGLRMAHIIVRQCFRAAASSGERVTDGLDEAIRQLKARAASKWDDGNSAAANECENCVLVLEGVRNAGATSSGHVAPTEAHDVEVVRHPADAKVVRYVGDTATCPAPVESTVTRAEFNEVAGRWLPDDVADAMEGELFDKSPSPSAEADRGT